MLAIVLRGGVPGENVLRLTERALSQFGGLPGLSQATFEELRTVHGILDRGFSWSQIFRLQSFKLN